MHSSIEQQIPFPKSAAPEAVENTFVQREARPGDTVMVTELIADSEMNVEERVAESSTQAIPFNFAQEAWRIIDAQRCDPDCYYIGMDLHSDNVVVTVIQSRFERGQLVGKRVYKKRITTINDGGATLVKELEPFCSGHTHLACVESTYNIYFVFDLFEERGWNIVIADPCAVSLARLKASNDFTDAEYLAERLRTNSLHISLILPHETRGVRDMVRHRGVLVQDRARQKIIITNMYANHRGLRLPAKIDKLVELGKEQGWNLDDPELTAVLPDRLARVKLVSLLQMVAYTDQVIEFVSTEIKKRCKEIPYTAALLKITGIGPVLATTIGSEIGDIARFQNSKNFVSYCRLAPTSRLSNGKKKGESNAKNGNAYLSWAMTEAANIMMRYEPRAKKAYERSLKKHQHVAYGRVIALRSLAARIARGIYAALSTGEVFDPRKCFG